MPKFVMTKSYARQMLTTLSESQTMTEAAERLGLPRTTFSSRLETAKKYVGVAKVAQAMRAMRKTAESANVEPLHPKVKPSSASGATRKAGGVATVKAGVEPATAAADKQALECQLLTEEVNRLRSLNKAISRDSLNDERVRRYIFGIAHTKPQVPEWLERTVSSTADSMDVPILFGSDWHWGEVVKPSEIGGVNKYNLKIAQQRLCTLIDTTINLLTNHMVKPNYPGIVFALGGDMVSGDIHDELSETNEMPIMPIVLDLRDHLVAAITRLKNEFGKVFLPCVCGNHGRNTHKIRSKEFNHTSFDWLTYQMLDRHFADDPDVIFFIPGGTDALVNVAGHRYLFTHGNAFRGGDGMIGALGPIIRGDHKKRGRNSQVGQEYDTLVIGHWHQLVQMKRVIVNGSLIGYNEYAYTNNFGYEPPQQALWITNSQHGITFSMPVNVAGDAGRESRDRSHTSWVTWHDPEKEKLAA